MWFAIRFELQVLVLCLCKTLFVRLFFKTVFFFGNHCCLLAVIFVHNLMMVLGLCVTSFICFL